MLTVYLDESGIHPTAPALTVAGYIASAEKWHRLDRSWRHFIAEEGIGFLHMTDLENRAAQFTGITNADKIRIIKRAHYLIQEIGAVGFGSAIKRDDFKEIIMGDAVAFEKIGSSYSLCASTILHQVAAWARSRQHSGAIQYVFGNIETPIDGKKVKHEMLDLFSQYKKIPFFRGYFFIEQPPIFADMKTVRPIQAADIHAYELAKYTNMRVGMTPPDRKVRQSLINLWTHVAFDNKGFWSRENLEELSRRVKEDKVDLTDERSIREYLATKS